MLDKSKIVLVVFALLMLIVTPTIAAPIDVSIEVITNSDSAYTIIEIRNRDSSGRIDVIVTTSLVDSNGCEIYSETRTIAIDTRTSFVVPVPVPDGFTGKIAVTVTDLDGEILGYSDNQVESPRCFSQCYVLLLVLVLLLLVDNHNMVLKMDKN